MLTNAPKWHDIKKKEFGNKKSHLKIFNVCIRLAKMQNICLYNTLSQIESNQMVCSN